MLFGYRIRQLRDENQMLQRQFISALEIATPMYSKIERGERRAKREQVINLAKIITRHIYRMDYIFSQKHIKC